jgi:hypothetical protein
MMTVFLADTKYYHAMFETRRTAAAEAAAGGGPVAAVTSRSKRKYDDVISLTPSVKGAINELARDRQMEQLLLVDDAKQLALTYSQRLRVIHTGFAKALINAHADRGREPSEMSFVPVCSVDHDNSQLVYSRPNVPLCTSGAACQALSVPNNQGCLHAFLLPGQAPATGSVCILCMRLHAQIMNACILYLDDTGGTAPVLMPPCTNLVNCPGGYWNWSLGVSPETQRIFDRQTSIVGVSSQLKTRYNPITNVWFIDQGAIVWQALPSNFRQVQQHHPST